MQKIKLFGYLSLLALTMGMVSYFAPQAHASQVTTFSDTLTRLKASTAANHEIFFVTPTGVAAAATVTLLFTNFTGVSSIAFGDVDFASGSTGVCTSASYTEQTLGSSASGATWGVGASGSTITITSGTGTVAAGKCIRVRIGTNATTGTTGTNQIGNGTAANSQTVTIGGSFGDSGIAAVPIIADDQVVVSGTVNPTMTMTLSANSVTFGTLTSANGRWADGSTGQTAAASLPTSAHTIAIGTNATSGYTLSYYGTNLTNGSSTITAATISSDSDGTPGTAQYALTASASGSSTIASGYARASSSSLNFVPTTTTTLASYTAPISDTITLSYLANIASTTPAGSYSSTITYIATGNF